MEYLQSIMENLPVMKWQDFLDIIIVAFLIYKLLPLLRSTGTSKIARVVVAIVVLSWITDEAHLYTLSFILSQFLQVDLDVEATDKKTVSAGAYLVIDRETGLPTEMGLNMERQHTINSVTYQLTYQLEQTVALSDYE